MFERYSIRARQSIFMALWSARRRGGQYIEPEDLLHALIREDRGELPAIGAEVFGAPRPIGGLTATHAAFFSDDTATDLLRELHEDSDLLTAKPQDEKQEAMPRVDMPVSDALKKVLASVTEAHQSDTKDIKPLDLLAGLLADQDSRLAQLLRDHGITRENVSKALDSY